MADYNRQRKQEFYLVLSQKGYYNLSGRLTSKTPGLSAGEIVVKLNVNVPDALFSRPQLQASITVPDNMAPSTISAQVLDNVKEVLQQQTGMDITVSLVEPME